MKALKRLKKHFHSGQVYRRAELVQWSNAVDRHLKQLVKDRTLQKVSPGLYYCSVKASFGEVPPKDEELIRAFLKNNEFLLTTLNVYNALEIGTTQLYNKSIVYNHKRHGEFTLGGKIFDFRLKHKFPKTVTKEFLFVDLLNNLGEIAEDRKEILKRTKEKILAIGNRQMMQAVNSYGGERTKKLFNSWLKENAKKYAA